MSDLPHSRRADPGKVAHFRIDGRLGAGGMGVVYRAEDEQLRRMVAVKLLGAGADDPERRQRFLREARAAAGITHPNVAVVYQVGEHEGLVYIVMELVPGESLRERLLRGPLPPELALDVAGQIARGLTAAHDKGIVHRDLKPENVMITPAGDVKLLDFGLAKAGVDQVDTSRPDLECASTVTGVTTDAAKLLGTPEYMSPEQARGDPLDLRSDVFSFGIVLFEMLTGVRPFSRRTVSSTLIAIASEPVPSLREHAPAVSEVTEEIVLRCLAKSPSQRFRNAGEVATALATNVATLTSISAGEVLAVRPAATPVVRAHARSPRVPLLSVGVLAVATLGGWLLLSRPAVVPAVPTATKAAPSSEKPITLVDAPLPVTTNAEALATFEKGRIALHDEHGGSKMLFRKATQLDPDFAAGYLYIALADANGHQTTPYQEAFRRSDKLGERDRDVMLALEPVFMQEPSDRKAAADRLTKLLARRPNDAQVWLLHALVTQYDSPEVAESSFERALLLDPAYAEAWYNRAGLHLRLHREDDALHDLERCLAAVPKAALCVQLQMDIHSGRLECEAAEKDARQWRRLRPDLDAPFRALADILAAEGKPLGAIEELLHHASEAKEMSTSDALPRSAWDAVHLATFTGDLGEAARAVSELAARVDKDSRDLVHAEPAEALIRLYTEMGDPSRAAAAARSYLDRRDAFSTDLRPIDSYGHFYFQDITLVSLGAVFRAGGMGGMRKEDFLHRRGERETLLRAAWHDDWAMWCWRASGIETEEEAHETLDEVSQVPAAPGGVDDESDPGRALVLAGRIDEAIPRLENSVSVCRGLTTAFSGTRSAYFLGMAREAKGNHDGACDAYRIVLNRWGHAKPRSVTGERALAHARALHCVP